MQLTSSSFKHHPHFLLRIFFILNVLFSTRFFSIVLIDKRTIQFIEIVVLGLLFCLCLFSNKKYTGLLKNNFNYLLIFTLTASVPAYIYHDQAFYLSFYASRVVIYLYIYKFLHVYNFKSNYVLKVLFYVGLIWTVIMIIQSFTFPQIMFRNKALEIEEYIKRARGNIIRIGVSDVRFAVLLLLGYANVYFIKKNFLTYKLIFLAFSIYGIFLTGTRQLIFSILLLLIILYLTIEKNKIKKKYYKAALLLIVLVFVFIMFPASSTSFEVLTNKTIEDLNDSNIRLLSGMFYFFEYWPENNPILAYFFGNGFAHGQSDYGKEIMNYHWEVLGFYREDIGLIGAFNKFGLFYFLTYISIIYKFLKVNYAINFYYIKFFIIFLLATSFTGANHLESSPIIIIITCLAFIIDKKKQFVFDKSKQSLANNNNK